MDVLDKIATAAVTRTPKGENSLPIKPVIFKTFPLAEAAEAHRLMESSQHIGNVITSYSIHYTKLYESAV